MSDDEKESEERPHERPTGEVIWQNALNGEYATENNRQKAFVAWVILQQEMDVEAERETGRIVACENGIWLDHGEQALRERLATLVGNHFSRGLFREVLEQVRAKAATPISEFGLPNGLVATETGLLDLGTRELRELRPEDRALYRLPVEYEPEAECPSWESFLETSTDGEAARRQLQEFVGYCIAGGEPWLKKALMILGPTDAGKTIFLETVEELFGPDANAGVTPQYLANERWGKQQLDGAPVNIRHDVDSDSIQRLGILKEVIDGNAVMAERKGEDPYQFRPETRLLFAANRPPQRVVEDRAFWNRWLTVVFPESVPPEDQQPKTDLLSELGAELPGILNWVLDGYERLVENDGFTEAPSPEENRRLWEEYGSPVERFKANCLERAPGEAVPVQEVREEFTLFCLENGHEDLSDQELTRELTRDPSIAKKQRRIDGERPRVYTGVRLKSNGADEWADGDEGDAWDNLADAF